MIETRSTADALDLVNMDNEIGPYPFDDTDQVDLIWYALESPGLNEIVMKDIMMMAGYNYISTSLVKFDVPAPRDVAYSFTFIKNSFDVMFGNADE